MRGNQRWNRERQIKGQDERKRRERRRLLLKGMCYAPSLPPRAEIHTLFEQHKGNGRKGDVKSESKREQGNEEVGMNWKKGNCEIQVIINER